MTKAWKAAGGAGTIGLEVVLSVLVGFFGGRWLDDKLHTHPYLAVAGFLFGIAAAVKAMVRSLKQMQKEARREEREQGNPAPLFDDFETDRDLRSDAREQPHEGPAPDDAQDGAAARRHDGDADA